MRDKRSISGLYAIVDTAYVPLERAAERAAEALLGGVRIIQLRAKDSPAKDALNAAMALKSLAGEFNSTFIVNDRIDIALLSGADGVHIGQDDIRINDARKLLGPDSIIGVSTHNIQEALEAESLGANYISFGPIFPTATKKDAEAPKGVELLKEITGKTKVPVVAIGGITMDNMGEVLEAGAESIAMISELFKTEGAASRVSSIISRINGTRP